MPYILVDTCVFVGLGGKHKPTYDCFMTTSDVIGTTKEIIHEYEGRAYPSKIILLSFLQGLHGNGRLKIFSRSYVEAKVNRYKNTREVNYPPHPPDKKWIDVAIAIKAKYIVTTNGHLINTRPNRCNDEVIEIIDPSAYVDVSCPQV